MFSKQFLSDNLNIFFTKSDKGNVTIYMHIVEYKGKMNSLLDDKKTYLRINENSLKSLQNKTSKILKHLNDNKFLDTEFQNSKLTLSDTTISKSYGLLNIHKKDIPLRAIISTINGPIHFLSKILYHFIKPCIQKLKSYIDNSF